MRASAAVPEPGICREAHSKLVARAAQAGLPTCEETYVGYRRELGIGSILAYSPQAKGRIERSFLTAQDRLVKHLRLAKVSTLEGANAFLEKEYWPEWNTHFARPVADFPNQHRQLTPQLDLAAILSHVEERVIGNDYTISFAGRRYQIDCAWNSVSTAS
jgi:hypothetical protein